MTASCPICKKPVVFEFRPFCSKRCADLDLARWFRGEYRIEGEEEVDKDKKDPQAEDLE